MNLKNEKIKEETIVPIFFASDKRYLPYLTVAVASLVDHAKTNCQYKIYVLTADLDEKDMLILKKYQKENISIEKVDTNAKIESIRNKVPLRDYYSVSIYFRLFIPSLFPQYKKAIYLDSDIVLNSDIAKMFNVELKDNYVAAVLDEVIWSSKEFTYYANNALDVTQEQYFNSGVLVMNLEKFRNENIEEDFYNCINKYNFGTVAPDQDYLNCVCRGKVVYLDPGYNKMPMGEKLPNEKLLLIHFNMFMKPWRYTDTMFGEYFWKYAKQTEFYNAMLKEREAYTQESKDKDKLAYNNLVKMALEIANSNNNYKKVFYANRNKK